ncbi:MAG: hypothetical protein ACOCZF_01195 [Halorhodospira sp.]
MLQQEEMHIELRAFSVALATGVLGALLASVGLHGLGGLLLAICVLALFVLVIPGIAAKLGPSAQSIPAATLLILGLWLMAGVGEGLSGLRVLALVVGIATVLMPFVLIPLGGRLDPQAAVHNSEPEQGRQR